MTVESVRLRLLLVAPLRLVLGMVVPNDPRARFRRSGEPAEVPAEAILAPAWLHALHAALPSTVGVSILAAVTLAFARTLTALLAGVLVGLGIVAALRAYGMDGRVYLDPWTGSVFRGRLPD